MSLKTKTFGTLIALVIVAGVGLWANQPPGHTPNGHKKPGKMVTLDVTFSNAPRNPMVRVSYRVGMDPKREILAESNWKHYEPVLSGAKIWVKAEQVQSGSLFCRIQVDGKDLAWDHNLAEQRDWVFCEAVIP